MNSFGNPTDNSAQLLQQALAQLAQMSNSSPRSFLDHPLGKAPDEPQTPFDAQLAQYYKGDDLKRAKKQIGALAYDPNVFGTPGLTHLGEFGYLRSSGGQLEWLPPGTPIGY